MYCIATLINKPTRSQGIRGTARCLFVSATSLFGLQVWQFVGECLGRRAVAEFPHGTVVGLVDDLLHVPRHVGADGGPFGQVSPDHAVPVLVAAALPGAVRIGEVGGHPQPVAKLGMPGELRAVVVGDAGPGVRRQRGEQRRLGVEARPGRLVGNDAGHGEPGPALDLGVQMAARPDDAVGLPMTEAAAIPGIEGPFVDRSASGYRETGRPPAAAPAPAPVPARQAARPPVAPRPIGVDPTVDRLRAHAHERVVGKIHAQPS